MISREILSLPGAGAWRSFLIAVLRTVSAALEILLVCWALRVCAGAGTGLGAGSGAQEDIGAGTGTGPAALRTFAIGAVCLILGDIALRLAAAWLASRLEQRVGTALGAQITQAALSAEGRTAQETAAANSSVARLATEGVSSVAGYLTGYLPCFFQTLLMIPVTLAILVPIAGWAAAVVCAGMVVLPMAAMASRKKDITTQMRQLGLYENVGDEFSEALEGMPDLTVFRADGRVAARLRTKSEGFRAATMDVLSGQLTSLIAADAVIALSVIGAVTLAATTGPAAGRLMAALTVAVVAVRLFAPERQLVYLSHSAAVAMRQGREISAVVASERSDSTTSSAGTPSQPTEPVTGGAHGAHSTEKGPDDGAGQDGTRTYSADDAPLVRATGLSFVYPNGHRALDGLTFAFPAHGVIAVTGASGSGKSTLVRLLVGEEHRYDGSLLLDGEEAADIERAQIIPRLSLVRGTDRPLAGTIRSNLDLAEQGIDDEAMIDALSQVGLWEEIRTDGGLDRPVAPGGSNLSGGQRQRLAIARVLLRHTGICVFDEATSAVDQRHDAQIARLMRRLGRDRLVITVTHRLASVRGADRIVVLDHGRLVQEGTFGALATEDGPFARQWREQSRFEVTETGGQTDSRMDDGTDGHAGNRPADQAGVGTVTFTGATDGSRTGDPTIHITRKEQKQGHETRQHPDSRPGIRTHECGNNARTRNNDGRHRTPLPVRMARLVGPLAPVEIRAIICGALEHLLSLGAVMCAAVGLVNINGSVVGSGAAGWLIVGAAMLLVRGIFSYLEQYSNHQMAFSTLRDIRSTVFDHMRLLSPAKLTGKGRGNLVTVLTNDIELLEIFYAHTLSPLAIAVICALTVTGLVGTLSPRLGFVAFLAFMAVGAVIPLVFARPTAVQAERQRAVQGWVRSRLLEALDCKDEIVALGAAPAVSRRLEGEEKEMGGARFRAGLLTQADLIAADAVMLVSLLVFTVQAALCAGIGVTGGAGAAGSISTGAALVALAGFATAFPPLLSVARLGSGLQPTIAAAHRVFGLLDEEPAVRPVPDGKGIRLEDDPSRTLTASHVRFAYPSDRQHAQTGADTAETGQAQSGQTQARPEETGKTLETEHNDQQVLRDITLSVGPGQIVAIHGPNGAGKTTLLDVLLRFRERTGGDLTIDGHPVEQIETSGLRRAETLVGQDPYIFSDTLAGNIRLGKASASREEVERAASAACLDEVVDELPGGLDHVLVRHGEELSQGQRQRVAVARAFLSDAPIVLLDEPTSNMDGLLEGRVLAALVDHRGADGVRPATVIVTHHEAVLRRVAAMPGGRVYRLEGGRLVAE